MDVQTIQKKIGDHIPCGYSMLTIQAFDYIENKRTLHSGIGCMKKFCSFLREHAKNIDSFEKKIVLTLCAKNRNCYICGKKNLTKAH